MKTSIRNRYDKSIGVVCCYFNPCNYASRFFNYITFIENIKKKNIKIVPVEVYGFTSKYRIDTLHQDTISIRSNEIYWMKECLLNIGIKKLLSEGYENIVCIDADIIFKSDTWTKDILNGLKKNNVVQIFETCYEQTNSSEYIHGNSSVSLAKKQNNILGGLLSRQGEVGYGYAYKSEVLSQCLLYDKAILGSGDFANIFGCVYQNSQKHLIVNDRFFCSASKDFISDYISWAEKMSRASEHRVGFCAGEIYVLPHGNRLDRNYIGRESIIKKYKFKPTKDLLMQLNGIYELSTKLINMKLDIKKYFYSRDEDKNILDNTKKSTIDSLSKLNFYDTDFNKIKINSVSSYLIHRNNISMCEHGDSKHNIDNFKNNQKPLHGSEKSKPKIKHETCIILSMHTKKDIKSYNDKLPIIVFSKNNKLGAGIMTMNTHKFSPAHTYLSYIISEYNNLPQNIIFTNDLTSNKTIDNWINTTNDFGNYNTIPNSTKRLSLDTHGHIRGITKYYDRIPKKSSHDFKTWFQSLFPHERLPSRYTPGSIFSTTRKSIIKNDISFYKNIINTLSAGDYHENEHYIECVWDIIFK